MYVQDGTSFSDFFTYLSPFPERYLPFCRQHSVNNDKTTSTLSSSSSRSGVHNSPFAYLPCPVSLVCSCCLTPKEENNTLQKAKKEKGGIPPRLQQITVSTSHNNFPLFVPVHFLLLFYRTTNYHLQKRGSKKHLPFLYHMVPKEKGGENKGHQVPIYCRRGKAKGTEKEIGRERGRRRSLNCFSTERGRKPKKRGRKEGERRNFWERVILYLIFRP